MAYATYTTDAIVCGTWKRNTADCSYLLFTREAGMLYADARSVREERSKQRYALQDFSAVRVSLVKGKRGWKIGSIEPQGNYYSEALSKEARGSVVTLFRFIRRFLGGEEAFPELYDTVIVALTALSKVTEHRDYIEKVAQIRILLTLGYVDPKETPPVVLALDFSNAAAPDSGIIQIVDRLIEKAVSISHL